MKKPAFTLVLCLLLALLTMLRSYAAAADALPHITPAGTDTLDVPCAAAILIDEDSGTVLYEKNADQQRPIASITKVMTLLLTFEALSAGRISLSDTVPVSEHAYHMGGSQIWLEPGEQMTLDDMLKAICISSANDAAVAVAEFVGGSEPAFVQQMNARAAELGLTNTHFENACGLDAEGHLSTARDVAMMSREILLHHAEVRNYCSIWMDSLRDGATQLINTNKLLKTYNGITGLKTGTTSRAGVCISASADARGFAASGGVAQAVVNAIKKMDPDREVKVMSAQGLADCKKMMMMAKAGKYNGYLLEGMACPGGCIAGAGTLADPAKSAMMLNKYKNEAAMKVATETPYQDSLDLLKY